MRAPLALVVPQWSNWKLAHVQPASPEWQAWPVCEFVQFRPTYTAVQSARSRQFGSSLMCAQTGAAEHESVARQPPV